MTSEKERNQSACLMSLWSGHVLSQTLIAPFDGETVFDTECLRFKVSMELGEIEVVVFLMQNSGSQEWSESCRDCKVNTTQD